MSILSQFNYRITGRAVKGQLVFLHGLMGSGANWRSIAKAFEEEYEILVYDQRGHGKSIQPKTGYSPEDYALDLKKILEELKWEKINLVGHSMGGRNALSFTNSEPEKVEKLVIEDIGPERHPEAYEKIEALIGPVPVPFANKTVAKEYFKNRFEDKILGEYLYSNISKTEDGSFSWRFYSSGVLESVREGRYKERWDQVENLKCPTLFIRGENSDELDLNEFKKILNCNSVVRGVEIKGAGHWVHFDNPKEFISELKKFLD